MFAELAGRITKDSVAGRTGEPLVPRDWQRRLFRETFARDPLTGRRRHRTALWGMGRKNGKTGIVVPVALDGVTNDVEGAEVYSCAADREQARLVFDPAVRTVEMVPELSERLKVYRTSHTIENRKTGSIYRALSSEAYTKEGLSPTLVIADELHAWPSRELYDVMSLAMGARVDPLMLIVTTAGVRSDTTGQDSIAYTLWQYGVRVAEGTVNDPSFYLAWWTAPEGCAVDDVAAWRAANPGYGDILDPADLASQAARALTGGASESEFRIKRLNQWVSSARTWLPVPTFQTRRAGRRLERKERVVLFFDGSFNHDCTALVACTIDGHLEPLALWERPIDDPDWEVPVEEVDARVHQACRDYTVLEIAADPFRWTREIQLWASEGLPAIEFPTTSAPRMVAACATFYDAVIDGRLTYGGDPVLVAALERHLGNAVVKVDRLGPRIVKEHRGSQRSIDLAICAVGAYDRATFYAAQPATPKRASSGWV